MAPIQTKIEELTAELQVTVENHNQALEAKTNLYNHILELQGALKVLNQLKKEDEDGGTDS